jgi:hypothetical protein
MKLEISRTPIKWERTITIDNCLSISVGENANGIVRAAAIFP